LSISSILPAAGAQRAYSRPLRRIPARQAQAARTEMLERLDRMRLRMAQRLRELNGISTMNAQGQIDPKAINMVLRNLNLSYQTLLKIESRHERRRAVIKHAPYY